MIIIFGNKLCPEYQYLTKVYGLDFVYVFVTSKQEKKLMQLTRGGGEKTIHFLLIIQKDIYFKSRGWKDFVCFFLFLIRQKYHKKLVFKI